MPTKVRWVHLDPHGLSLGFIWLRLDSLGHTWIHSDSLGLTLFNLFSLGLIWIHLDALGFTWTHLESLGLGDPKCSSKTTAVGTVTKTLVHICYASYQH